MDSINENFMREVMFMKNLQAYNKAIASGIVGLIAVIVAYFGLNFAPELEAAVLVLVMAVVSTVSVYAIPNK